MCAFLKVTIHRRGEIVFWAWWRSRWPYLDSPGPVKEPLLEDDLPEHGDHELWGLMHPRLLATTFKFGMIMAECRPAPERLGSECDIQFIYSTSSSTVHRINLHAERFTS